MTKRNTALRGHGLPFEGRLRNAYGRMTNDPGKAKCECGATSRDELPNTAARKRWHAEHKQEVRDA